MVEVFLVQFLAAALGSVSTAAADWCYRNARISQRVHSFWVSASISAIYLPVLVWMCLVFLGFWLLSQAVAGVVSGTVFFWVYRNLQQLPALPNLGPQRPPPRSTSGAVPPASRANH